VAGIFPAQKFFMAGLALKPPDPGTGGSRHEKNNKFSCADYGSGLHFLPPVFPDGPTGAAAALCKKSGGADKKTPY
jgi:hypothetical protein